MMISGVRLVIRRGAATNIGTSTIVTFTSGCEDGASLGDRCEASTSLVAPIDIDDAQPNINHSQIALSFARFILQRRQCRVDQAFCAFEIDLRQRMHLALS